MRYKSSDLFQCTDCGLCCKGYGGTFISEEDLERIAAFIQVEKTQFISNYCQLSGGKWVVVQAESGYCMFWNNGCTIHPVKPRMCKAWPFIEGVERDLINWQIMAGECAGIRTDIPDAAIKRCVRQVLGTL